MNTNRLLWDIVGITAVGAILLLGVSFSEGATATGSSYGFTEKAAFATSGVQPSWIIARGPGGGKTMGGPQPAEPINTGPGRTKRAEPVGGAGQVNPAEPVGGPGQFNPGFTPPGGAQPDPSEPING
ncbi:MAG: hypothetical protein FJ118_13160 [Deltaproteobacteria bacterium]|nr:hypothetical protein [Deltaproteobacteria bacterium]